MAKIMVTGVNGFVGKHLVRELTGRGIDVVGVGREKIVHPEIVGLLAEYQVCDLTNAKQVSKLPLYELSGVINLAGLAKMGDSFVNPDLYMQVNVAVFSVLSQRLLAIRSTAIVVAISSGAVYRSDQPMPLIEKSFLIAEGSPYAFSKIAMEQEALRLRKLGLKCAVARPFNHIGPGQETGFLVPDLYEKIQAARSTDGIVRVGDLSTKRDYTDVRDVVRAYADLALGAELSESIYNVCSGNSTDGETILAAMLKATGAKNDIIIKQDPTLIRPNDPKDLFGSNRLLHAATGWQPVIPLERTIQDFVDSKISA